METLNDVLENSGFYFYLAQYCNLADFDEMVHFWLVSVFRGQLLFARKILFCLIYDLFRTYFVSLTSHSNEMRPKSISKVKIIMNNFGPNRE